MRIGGSTVEQVVFPYLLFPSVAGSIPVRFIGLSKPLMCVLKSTSVKKP